MTLPRISLQALEAFERVAQSGSMQDAARDMGLSISSVSHHVARLEEQLGVILLDRATRPFALTREGRAALHHMSTGLQHLRRATSESALGGVLGTRSLRLGIVEDFESNVTPDLAMILARRMPNATLAISNVLSHDVPDLLRKGALDIAVASEGDHDVSEVLSIPLLRDPFVFAVPVGEEADFAALAAGDADFSFLRFNKGHLIGRQIEAHLVRNRLDLPQRFAFDGAQSILAVVANGDGWSILTPLGFMRAQRFHDRVRLHALPLAAFARRVSVMARRDMDQQTLQIIAALLRQSIQRVAIDPVVEAYPWLRDRFALQMDG